MGLNNSFNMVTCKNLDRSVDEQQGLDAGNGRTNIAEFTTVPPPVMIAAAHAAAHMHVWH
jgi:hypothetical protein